MISYKYNIYHSKKTKYLVKILRECCFVWNHALALQRRYYKLFGKYISVDKMKKHFTKRIKRNLLHSQTTQEILERLDESYNRFFKKLAKRPPKFKSPEKFNSFVFKQGGFTLNGNCLTINIILPINTEPSISPLLIFLAVFKSNGTIIEFFVFFLFFSCYEIRWVT